MEGKQAPVHKTCILKPPGWEPASGTILGERTSLPAQPVLIQEGFTPRWRGQKAGTAAKRERRASPLWLGEGVACTPQEFTQDGTN